MARSLCVCGQIRDSRKPCERCGSGERTHGEVKYGSEWDRLSKRIRKDKPLCEVCEAKGRVSPATSVHHIVPVYVDETRKLDETNLISVCRECHEELDSECGILYGRITR